MGNMHFKTIIYHRGKACVMCKYVMPLLLPTSFIVKHIPPSYQSLAQSPWRQEQVGNLSYTYFINIYISPARPTNQRENTRAKANSDAPATRMPPWRSGYQACPGVRDALSAERQGIIKWGPSGKQVQSLWNARGGGGGAPRAPAPMGWTQDFFSLYCTLYKT